MTFFVNKDDTMNPHCNHEVHTLDCFWGKKVDENHRIYLYNCFDAKDAVLKAKKYYSDADGDIVCCPAAHHG